MGWVEAGGKLVNLQNLRRSISQMSFDEALSTVMIIRNSRHTRKIPIKKADKRGQVAKNQKTKDIISTLTTEQRKELLKGFLES